MTAPACERSLGQNEAAEHALRERRMNSIQVLLCGSIVGCWVVDAAVPQPFLTPLVMQTEKQPIPVAGGDARYHLVYELDLANFTGDKVSANRLQVLDASGGAVLADFDAAQVASRVVVRDHAAVPGNFGASQLGIVYLHV